MPVQYESIRYRRFFDTCDARVSPRSFDPIRGLYSVGVVLDIPVSLVMYYTQYTSLAFIFDDTVDLCDTRDSPRSPTHRALCETGIHPRVSVPPKSVLDADYGVHREGLCGGYRMRYDVVA